MLDGPDVAVVDLILPDGRGTKVTDAIRGPARPIRTALLTGWLNLDSSDAVDLVFLSPNDTQTMVRWIGEGPTCTESGSNDGFLGSDSAYFPGSNLPKIWDDSGRND